MIAEVVCVGTELLLGQITNTNARFVAETLARLGIDAYFQQVVGDNRARLSDTLRLALARSDLVVTVGGLGPTEDDLTKEVVAELLGLELVADPGLERAITCLLDRHRSRPLPEAVRKQSLVPEGAVVLPNPVGTAPGLLVTAGRHRVALLPGPPSELVPIVERGLVPELERLSAETANRGGREKGGRSFLHSRIVKVCGLGEPAVEASVRDLIHSTNPTVAPLVTAGETHLRVTAKAGSAEAARRLAGEMVARISERLGAHIFGYDDDTIAGACGVLLRQRRLTLALAESLTGGLVGHLVTEVPGASAFFERGFTVYSDRAKTELLGVEPEFIARHGAVSEPVALAMARGARERARADVSLSLTGLAGPGGAEPGLPVGLVFIGLVAGGPGGHEQVVRYQFSGDRSLVKLRAAHRALTMLWEYLRTRD